ncbi:MAG: helix-turn-helix transcriptional regulator [Pantoea sp.]|uniref:AraC family transcriptional regulator n=1 Tax=Pantoea brenneri TaxID=472694 RepID=A0AAX3J4C2_9GAMM|nr:MULTISPECIES: helix-turn-helix transcriptional regulator [Pantoea]MBS6033609.1 helix-turn-helix transcriptional regulator [Pantoea sp.]MDH2123910.1 helix-turn-helix transcriptional regulator [Pantoea brenneri]VXB60068.1 AraC family transcriptional regulator [Pantoea brenneri]
MTLQITYQPPLDAPQLHYFMRFEQANAHTEYLPHAHDWGQLIFVKSHVLEMRVEGERLLTPAYIPVWIPPGHRHSSYNHRQAQFRTFNLAAALCTGLPQRACLLIVDPIVHAIMDEFAGQQIEQPVTEAQWRLCEVLRDRLPLAQVQESYLPTSTDKFLAPVLHALEANPGDNTTLAGWAARVFTTERTLARRCQQQLHMTFGEWRQRLRFLRAIVLLEQGVSVQSIAHELGYSSASALIVMFQQQAGTTPDRYRARLG